jgi:hypothetical protein
MHTPTWEPAKFSFVNEIAPILIWSNARVKKAAKPLQNTIFLSLAAQPIATLTRFCSAM